MARVWGMSGVPKKRKHCSFEAFDAMTDDMKAGKEAARELAGQMAVQETLERNSLLLVGPTGRGKSGMMACIAMAWLNLGIQVLWVDFLEFLEAIRKTYEDGSEFDTSTIIETAQRAALLCLDDLGDLKSKKEVTDHTREKTYSIIRYRYEHELPTVITTNLGFEQMAFQFGPRITDRIYEMCHAASMDGKSLRFG